MLFSSLINSMVHLWWLMSNWPPFIWPTDTVTIDRPDHSPYAILDNGWTPISDPFCGLRGPAQSISRIVSGVDARPEELPWHSMLLKQVNDTWKFHCNSALVHPMWVVTAGHCVVNTTAKYRVRFGLVSIDEELSGGQEIEASMIFVHPDFLTKEDLITNDLALIRLQGPVLRSMSVGTVCLPDEQLFGEPIKWNRCLVSGWGRLQLGGRFADQLQKTDVNIWLQDECQKRYTGMSISASHVCFGGVDHGVCHGDSGGPVVCRVNDRWTAVGVTSFGSKCHRDVDVPAVGTRLSAYSKWIWQTIGQNTELS